jgi:hypothetical protein
MVSAETRRSNGIMKIARACTFTLALLLAAAPGVSLAEAGSPLTDTLSLGLGTFVVNTGTDIRVDGSGGIRGTEINLERDLGVGDTNRFRLDGYWRFAEHHKIRVMYFDTDRTVSHVLSRDITFQGTTYPIDAHMETRMRTSVTEVAYAYAFVHNDHWELDGTAGIHNLKFSLGLTGNLQNLQISKSQSASANGPLPVIGIEGIWRLVDTLYLDAQAQFFRISISPYDGRLEDYNVSLMWQPLQHVAFGAGYDQFVTRVDVSADSFNGNLRWRYSGARIFVTVSL